MTILLDQAIEALRRLSPDAQDDIARLVLQLAQEPADPITLSAEEREAISASKAAADRGGLATDEQVRVVWAKRGL